MVEWHQNKQTNLFEVALNLLFTKTELPLSDIYMAIWDFNVRHTADILMCSNMNHWHMNPIQTETM